jgi:hypothetical protein
MFVKKLVYFILIPAITNGVSCVQIKRKNHSKADMDPTSTSKTANPNESHFQWKLEDTGKPYYYRWTLKWDQSASDNILHLFINGEEADQTAITSPLHLDLPAARDTQIELKAENADRKWGTVWSQTITTPEDLYITDFIKLDKPKTIKVQRLFFGEKGKILTMGHALKIEVQRLYSQGGVIETFSEGTKAIVGDGRTPSPITLDAIDASGELSFHLRGESGADGKNGEQWTTKQNNAPAAAEGKVHCSYFPLGGNTGQLHKVCLCEILPHKGNDGPKGQPGHPGENGGKGGDSGNLSITLKNASKNFLPIGIASQGFGGAKGLGGPGQEGGAPSPAGKVVIPPGGYNQCRIAPDGVPMGPGEKGRDGVDGANGIKTNYCVSISSDRHCYSF